MKKIALLLLVIGALGGNLAGSFAIGEANDASEGAACVDRCYTPFVSCRSSCQQRFGSDLGVAGRRDCDRACALAFDDCFRNCVKPVGRLPSTTPTPTPPLSCRCPRGQAYYPWARYCYRPRRSVFCPEVYRPVCGCDGTTYPNSCYANRAGVKRWKSGRCR